MVNPPPPINDGEKYDDIPGILGFPSYAILRDSLDKNNNYHISNKSRGRQSMDSMIFDVAEFIHRKTNNHQLAFEYYKIIVEYYKDSNLYPDASLAMNNINPNSDWLSSFLEKKYEDFLDIERFVPRTAEEVIEATKNRLFPEDFQAKMTVEQLRTQLGQFGITPEQMFEQMNMTLTRMKSQLDQTPG